VQTKESIKHEHVEKILEAPQVDYKEWFSEVPTAQSKESIKQEHVEKTLEMPKVDYEEGSIEVPTVQTKESIKHEHVEKTLAVPQVDYEERIIEVPTAQTRGSIKHEHVEKTLEVLRVDCEECTVEISTAQTKEFIKQIPTMEVDNSAVEFKIRELVKQAHRQEVGIVEQKVTNAEHEYVEKIVGVPQVDYEDWLIEVRTMHTKEFIKQVPKTWV